MSMSTDVIGIRPPDDYWRKMKTAYDACQKAGVPIPKEVHDFFNLDEYNEPDPEGVRVHLPAAAQREWGNDMSQGIEVLLDELPDGIKIVRFFNSW